MANLTKIMVAVLVLVLAVLGVEGYYYWQMKNKIAPKTQKTEQPAGVQQISASGAPSVGDPIVNLAGLDLQKIDKKMVEDWMAKEGVVDLDKVNVLAGRFVSVDGLKVNVVQGKSQKQISLAVPANLRLKQKTGELVSLTSASGKPDASAMTTIISSPYLTKDDLLLFLNVSGSGSQFSAPDLIVFK